MSLTDIPEPRDVTSFWSTADPDVNVTNGFSVFVSSSSTDQSLFEKEWQSNGAIAGQALSLVVMWLGAVTGNTLVCLVIYRSRRLQSTTNYFVMSLAFTDLCLAVLCMPFLLGDVLARGWIFGNLMCKLVRFIQCLAPGVTMFVFVSIAIDRFYTILHPLSFKVTRGKAKQLVFGGWISALFIASPCFYFYEVREISGLTHCQTYAKNTWGGILYVTCVALLEYVMPCVTAVAIYVKIFKHIWRAGIGGRTFQRTTHPVPRSKVKMVKMIMVVTSVNVALMLPYFAVQLWYFSLGTSPEVNHSIYISAVWLYMSTCVMKPALYVCFNSNFRRGCKEMFCMSNLKCYRGSAYTITTASKFSKKNHVGILDAATPRECRYMESPSRSFGRGLELGKMAEWSLASQSPSTYL